MFPCGTYEKSFLVDGERLTALVLSPAYIRLSSSLVTRRERRILIIVVFPSPDGPTRATISPGWASKHAFLNTQVPVLYV